MMRADLMADVTDWTGSTQTPAVNAPMTSQQSSDGPRVSARSAELTAIYRAHFQWVWRALQARGA